MATKVLHTIFLLKRGTNAQWIKHNPILRKGEPGFVTDKNILKIGDGETPFLDLAPIAGGGGGGTDLPVDIHNPKNGQFLVYDGISHAWHNLDLTTNNSITWDDGLSLAGYDNANIGTMPVKSASGLNWITPTSGEVVEQAAERAENAAINAENAQRIAGNYAAEAATSAVAAAQSYTDTKALTWKGTYAEYAALPERPADTIFYILQD